MQAVLPKLPELQNQKIFSEVYEADGKTIKLIDFGFSVKGYLESWRELWEPLDTCGPQVIRLVPVFIPWIYFPFHLQKLGTRGKSSLNHKHGGCSITLFQCKTSFVDSRLLEHRGATWVHGHPGLLGTRGGHGRFEQRERLHRQVWHLVPRCARGRRRRSWFGKVFELAVLEVLKVFPKVFGRKFDFCVFVVLGESLCVFILWP